SPRVPARCRAVVESASAAAASFALCSRRRARARGDRSLYVPAVRAGLLVVIAVVACKDDSGTAHLVSTASEPAQARTAAPEPPGGPPSCADVGAQLASQVGAVKQIE